MIWFPVIRLLGFLRGNKAARIILFALFIGLAVYGWSNSIRKNAISDATLDFILKEQKEVNDAIERSKSGPRLDNNEFLDCLRNAKSGCL